MDQSQERLNVNVNFEGEFAHTAIKLREREVKIGQKI